MRLSENPTANSIGLTTLALFILGFIIVAMIPERHNYADFDCPVCGSDHVLEIDIESAICPDCGAQFNY